jgi:hypothetical protein
MASEWVVIGRTESDLASIATDSRWQPIALDRHTTAWTDDFSDILSVLKL